MAGLIRAAFLQSNLVALDALPGGVTARVRARIPEAVLRDVESALRTAWLPIEHDVAMTEAVHAEVGSAVLRRWAHDGLVHAIETPLLEPLIRSAGAIFGKTPASYLRWAPRMWSFITRECGELTFDAPDPHEAHLILEHPATVIVNSPVYLDGTAGVFEAALTLAEATGTLEFEIRRPDLVTFTCRWS